MLCLVRYSFTSLSPNEVAVFLATLWHNRQLTVRNEYPVPLLFWTALHYVWLERFRVHLWHHRSYCARPFNSVLFDIMTDYATLQSKISSTRSPSTKRHAATKTPTRTIYFQTAFNKFSKYSIRVRCFATTTTINKKNTFCSAATST